MAMQEGEHHHQRIPDESTIDEASFDATLAIIKESLRIEKREEDENGEAERSGWLFDDSSTLMTPVSKVPTWLVADSGTGGDAFRESNAERWREQPFVAFSAASSSSSSASLRRSISVLKRSTSSSSTLPSPSSSSSSSSSSSAASSSSPTSPPHTNDSVAFPEPLAFHLVAANLEARYRHLPPVAHSVPPPPPLASSSPSSAHSSSLIASRVPPPPPRQPNASSRRLSGASAWARAGALVEAQRRRRRKDRKRDGEEEADDERRGGGAAGGRGGRGEQQEVKEEIKIEEQVTVTHHDDVEIGLHNHGGGRSSSSSSSNSSLSKESSPSKEEQERRWRALFDRIDRNSDGHLTRVELLAALRRASPEVTRELHELLGIPERVRQEDGTRDDFVRVFEAIDRDESDSIELDEFVAYLQKANERWVGSGPPNSGEGSGDGDGDGRDGASRERLGEDWRQTHPRPLSVSASAAVAVNRRSSTPQRSGPSDGAEETSPDEAPDDAIPQDQIIIPQEGEVITPPEAEESLPREEVSTSQEEWSPPQDQIITPQEGEVITPPEAEEEALPQDEIASTPPKEVTPSPDNAAASPADDVPPDDDAAAPPEESSSPTTASITQGEDGAPDEGDPPLEDAESKDVAPFDEETLPLEDGAVPLLENVPSRSEQKGKFEEDSDTEEDTDVESDAEENEQILRERKPNP